MGTRFPPSLPRRHHHHHRLSSSSNATSPRFVISFASFPYHHTNIPNYSSIFHLRLSFGASHLALTSSSSRCHATSPASPPPPKPGPPDEENQTRVSVARVMSSFSKVQDGVRIFLAVLFWMSLFFWSCASDRGNNGRSNKDSRFRR